MSILDYKRLIAEGDSVFLYERHDRVHPILVKRGGIFNCRYGSFPHSDMIGLQYGSRVYARQGGGWMYCLAPTPELWTIGVNHRTQILYVADIAIVSLHLDLRPGSIVIESGTGSGSLSTSIARSIAPRGHLHTFDFHELRVQQAREDFERNKLSHLITATCRDVTKDGFGLEGVADAVFLDLPNPWLVVSAASAALKPDGALCSFSPCIEQVQKTSEALRGANFQDVKTLECLLRTYDVRSTTLRIPSFESAPATRAPSAGTAVTKTSAADNEGAEADGAGPADSACATNTGPGGTAGGHGSRKRPRTNGAGHGDGDDGQDDGPDDADADVEGAAGGGGGAEVTDAAQDCEDTDVGGGDTAEASASDQRPIESMSTSESGGGSGQKGGAERVADAARDWTCAFARPYSETRGHTGFLTFARKSIF